YSGGMPASVAYATPCGSTMTAPTSPASASARNVVRSMRCSQARNGKSFSAIGGIDGRKLRVRRAWVRPVSLHLALPRDDQVLDVAHQEVEQVRDDADDDDA